MLLKARNVHFVFLEEGGECVIHVDGVLEFGRGELGGNSTEGGNIPGHDPETLMGIIGRITQFQSLLPKWR